MPSETLREISEQAIKRMCLEAGIPDKAEQFLQESRSYVWVRDWLKLNTDWSPKLRAAAVTNINVEAVYARFNRLRRR